MHKKRKMDAEISGEYLKAAEALKKGYKDESALVKIYEYEEMQLSKRMLHSAKEKIHARIKAHLILSLLLLKDGYEEAAVDNIWETIKWTHRGYQIRLLERLHCDI